MKPTPKDSHYEETHSKNTNFHSEWPSNVLNMKNGYIIKASNSFYLLKHENKSSKQEIDFPLNLSEAHPV